MTDVTTEQVQKDLIDHMKDDEQWKIKVGELALLVSSVVESQRKLTEEVKEIKETVSWIKDFFEGMSFLKKVLIVLAITVGGVVTIGGGLKTILGWFLPK
jgi:hypothetical protein